MTGPVHDVFISYSRTDKEFARQLEKALEDYHPPKGLAVPQRRLSVFRDEADFTGVDYHRSLAEHLGSSGKLVVLCSPKARQSHYVNDEVRRFVEAKGPSNVIPVLLSGVPNNEALPGQDADKAFPDALVESTEMPLAADYRGFQPRRDRLDRGAFSDRWFWILANIYGISRNDIEEREKKRRARRQRIAAGAALSLIVVLSGALVMTLLSRQEAVRAAEEERKAQQLALEKQKQAEAAAAAERIAKEHTLAGALAARAELLVAQRGVLVELAGLLAVEAIKRAPSLESDRAIRRVVELLPRRVARMDCAADGEVSQAAFSPKGRHLATFNGNDAVTIWETASGRKLGKLVTGAVRKIAFHPTRNHLITIGNHGADAWDFISRQLVTRLRHEGARDVAYSSDGNYVASVGPDRTTRLWRSDDYAAIASMPNSEDMHFVAVAPDGAETVAWNRDKAEIFRSPGSPAQTLEFQGGSHFKYSNASPHGPYLAWVAPLSYAVMLYSVTSRQSLLFENRHWSVDFSANGRYFALASPEWDASVYSLPACDEAGMTWKIGANALLERSEVRGRGSCRRMAQVRHDDSVYRVTLSPEGSYLATTSKDGTIRSWDSFRGREVLRLLTAVDGAMSELVFSDDETLLSGWGRRVCQTWQSTGHRQVAALKHGDGVLDVAFSANGARAATVSQDGTARVWSIPDGRQLTQVATNRHQRDVALAPDGSKLIVGSDKAWDLTRQDKPVPASIRGNRPPVAISADWKIFLSLDSAKELVVSDATSGKRLSSRALPDRNLANIVISADGRRIGGTMGTGELWIWTWRGDEVVSLPASVRRPIQLSFDDSGRQVAIVDPGEAAGEESFVDVWNIDSRQRLRIRHEAAVRSAAFDPSGKFLAIASTDRTVRIWDLASKAPIAQFSHDADVQKVVFSPNGRYVLSAGGRSDRTARLWFWRPDDLVDEACSRLSRSALTKEEWTEYVGPEPHRPTCKDNRGR